MALCGNGVVEEGEQCDCGWEEDCEEDCCWPQRTEHPDNEKPCTLKPERDCSPSQGPCCTNTCTFKLGDKCLDDNGCREESYCGGTAPTCPLSMVKPNKTVCNKEFVCYKGECTGSICLAYGMESCQCTQGPDDSPTKPCELCCKEPGDAKPCLSSFELTDAPLDVPDMYSKPGTPCNNYQGYCDVFQKCRSVDPSGPLATLRKLLLSEQSIASLTKFLMLYWYTVIFIVLGVFILMAVIIKMCGKKTPLVRRRKRRRPTIQHNGTDGIVDGSNPDSGVQVHPTTVEHSVPLGKKVRKGENRSKKGRSSKSRERPTSNTAPLPSTGPLPQSPTSPNAGGGAVENNVEDGVARAVRLAANLGNQLFVDLPPEATARLRPSELLPESAITTTTSNGDRKSRGAQNKPPHKQNGASGRKHKSLSPEKRLASTFAQSMSSISKSFEKLDLVGHHRSKSHSRGQHQQHHRDRGAGEATGTEDHHRKRRRRSRPPTEQPSQKEVTIAKLGRFKFSVEVAKHYEKEAKDDTQQKTTKNRKSPREADSKARMKVSPSAESNKAADEAAKEAAADKLPSINVTNFNAQKRANANEGLQQPVPTFKPPASVIVSKKRGKERPRRESPEKTTLDKKRSTYSAGLDYRRSFGGKNERFTRSISHPGPAPDIDEIMLAGSDSSKDAKVRAMRNYSFANGQRPSTVLPTTKLRRSETERFFGRSLAPTKETPDNLWVSEFDNQAYDKSPEPANLKDKGSCSSSSLSSLSSPVKRPSFDIISSCSTDSDLELVTKHPGEGSGFSRAKILETVGVIVNNVTTPPSSSSGNLLLPPSSSSPSSSSSVSLTGASSPASYEAGAPDSEPRLAFIGCDSPSTSPTAGGGSCSSGSTSASATSSAAAAKRPSLSDRYPTSPSSSSTSSNKMLGGEETMEDNLDIISIITDGMN